MKGDELVVSNAVINVSNQNCMTGCVLVMSRFSMRFSPKRLNTQFKRFGKNSDKRTAVYPSFSINELKFGWVLESIWGYCG